MMYKTHQMVEIAQLGPFDFFGEDSLPEGIHVYSVVAASAVRVRWVRPDTLHHLSQNGFQNVMQAAYMRRQWRDRQHRVLQINRAMMAETSRELPLKSPTGGAAEAARWGTHRGGGGGGASSLSTRGAAAEKTVGGGTGNAASGDNKSDATARRNADTAMQSTINLTQWANRVSRSDAKGGGGNSTDDADSASMRSPPGAPRKSSAKKTAFGVVDKARHASTEDYSPTGASSALLACIDKRADDMFVVIGCYESRRNAFNAFMRRRFDVSFLVLRFVGCWQRK